MSRHDDDIACQNIITRAINVSENDKVTAQARQQSSQENAGRGESSDDCWMLTETGRMLRAVVDRSTHKRRRRQKLCRRWLTGAYGGQLVMMTTLNEGDVARWNPPTGRVHQRGTTVLLRVSTCTQGQQAWSNSLRRLEPVQLTEERSGVVVPRWRKHQPGSRVHHRLRLEPLQQVLRDSGVPQHYVLYLGRQLLRQHEVQVML